MPSSGKPPPKPAKSLPASASHCWGNDTLAALSDKLSPRSSNDHSIARFTWWDHKGTTEWVQYDSEQAKKISGASVYFFDDTGSGGCRIPKSWRLLYKDADLWRQVSNASGYGLQKDKFNTVKFDPVQTTSLRLEAQLKPDFSAGILEWRIDTNK